MSDTTIGHCGGNAYWFEESGPDAIANGFLDKKDQVNILKQSGQTFFKKGEDFVQQLFTELISFHRYKGLHAFSPLSCTPKLVDRVVPLLSSEFRRSLGPQLDQVLKIRAMQKIYNQIFSLDAGRRFNHTTFIEWKNQIDNLVKVGNINNTTDRAAFSSIIKTKIEHHIAAPFLSSLTGNAKDIRALNEWKEQIETLAKFGNLDITQYKNRIREQFQKRQGN